MIKRRAFFIHYTNMFCFLLKISLLVLISSLKSNSAIYLDFPRQFQIIYIQIVKMNQIFNMVFFFFQKMLVYIQACRIIPQINSTHEVLSLWSARQRWNRVGLRSMSEPSRGVGRDMVEAETNNKRKRKGKLERGRIYADVTAVCSQSVVMRIRFADHTFKGEILG